MLLIPLLFLLVALTSASTRAIVLSRQFDNPILDVPAYIGCISQLTFAEIVLAGEVDHKRGLLSHQADNQACINHCLNTTTEYGHYNYSYFDHAGYIKPNCFCAIDQYPAARRIKQGLDSVGNCTTNQATATYLHSRFYFSDCATYVFPADDYYDAPYDGGLTLSAANCSSICEKPYDNSPTMSIQLNNTLNEYQCGCYFHLTSGGPPARCGSPNSFFIYYSFDAPGPARQ